jgi:predicted dehydrogenase
MTNAHSGGVAVIGGGMAGRAHAAGFRTASTLFSTDRPDVRLVAIADVNRAVADDTARDTATTTRSAVGKKSPLTPR